MSNKKVKQQDEKISIKNKPDSYPVFCFKHLQQVSYNECKESNFFITFLERLQKLALLGWKEIDKSARHAYGYEKIPVRDLKVNNKPSIMTPDVKELTVFRATGSNLPFLGLRVESTFHIIYIETNFGDIYKH